MPIYEYRCAACGHELEALQRFADAPMVKCPSCGKETLNKLVSAAGFQLKGSGWYATDFKNSGSKPAAKATAPAEGGSASAEGSEGKATAETKTDAKTSTESKPATADKSSATSAPSAPSAPTSS